MSPIFIAFALSLLFTAILWGSGIAPYSREFSTPARRLAAFILWVSVLALVVFLPAASYETGDSFAPSAEEFPLLFVGHALLAVFLVLWWRLEGRETLPAFLYLERTTDMLRSRALLGLVGGLAAWAATVIAVGTVGSIWIKLRPSEALVEIPPALFWFVELSAAQKATVVVVAMTVEEAFFRAFLQPRLGLVLSSICFAASHLSYGMPLLVVGVFTVSLFLGWLFHRTRHLLPSMIAHGTFDAVQLFLVLPWALEHVASGSQ